VGRRRVLLLLLLPFLAAGYYVVFGGEYSWAQLRAARIQVEAAQREVEAMEAENARLTARVEALELDPWTLEVLARERFGMIRPGEVLYRFTEPVRAPQSEVDTAQSPR
jgi:cell division protein FtsB